MQLHTKTAGCGYARQTTQWKNPMTNTWKTERFFQQIYSQQTDFHKKEDWRMLQKMSSHLSLNKYRVYNFNNHFTWGPIVFQHLHPCSLHVCIFMLCTCIFTSIIRIRTILTVADCTAVSRMQGYGDTTNYVQHQIFRGRNTT